MHAQNDLAHADRNRPTRSWKITAARCSAGEPDFMRARQNTAALLYWSLPQPQWPASISSSRHRGDLLLGPFRATGCVRIANRQGMSAARLPLARDRRRRGRAQYSRPHRVAIRLELEWWCRSWTANAHRRARSRSRYTGGSMTCGCARARALVGVFVAGNAGCGVTRTNESTSDGH